MLNQSGGVIWHLVKPWFKNAFYIFSSLFSKMLVWWTQLDDKSCLQLGFSFFSWLILTSWSFLDASASLQAPKSGGWHLLELSKYLPVFHYNLKIFKILEMSVQVAQRATCFNFLKDFYWLLAIFIQSYKLLKIFLES